MIWQLKMMWQRWRDARALKMQMASWTPEQWRAHHLYHRAAARYAAGAPYKQSGLRQAHAARRAAFKDAFKD